MTAYLLLGPGTPMLFQGQEFASSAPFLYFADHHGEVGRMVREGRKEFLSQFRSIATREMMAALPDATARETFERCTLDFGERERHHEIYRMHADLLTLRRRDPVLSAQRPRGVDGAVLGLEAFLLRFFDEGRADRLLLVNLGADLTLNPAPEPLLAPPAQMLWRILWSSDDVRYGGSGVAPVETPRNWRIPGHATVLLEPRPRSSMDDPATEEGEESEEAEIRREGLKELGRSP
jgi:maltooligosyltrehalose trehalohydrolase